MLDLSFGNMAESYGEWKESDAEAEKGCILNGSFEELLARRRM
jgi:hypothetical protein